MHCDITALGHSIDLSRYTPNRMIARSENQSTGSTLISLDAQVTRDQGDGPMRHDDLEVALYNLAMPIVDNPPHDDRQNHHGCMQGLHRGWAVHM
jgi:hypothetical protein